MSIANLITLGIGPQSDIPHLITLGLDSGIAIIRVDNVIYVGLRPRLIEAMADSHIIKMPVNSRIIIKG